MFRSDKSLPQITREELKLRHLAANNGIAQIRHLVHAVEGNRGVLFWIVVLLLCVGGFIYHSLVLYEEFRRHDIVTDTEVHIFKKIIARAHTRIRV